MLLQCSNRLRDRAELLGGDLGEIRLPLTVLLEELVDLVLLPLKPPSLKNAKAAGLRIVRSFRRSLAVSGFLGGGGFFELLLSGVLLGGLWCLFLCLLLLVLFSPGVTGLVTLPLVLDWVTFTSKPFFANRLRVSCKSSSSEMVSIGVGLFSPMMSRSEARTSSEVSDVTVTVIMVVSPMQKLGEFLGLADEDCLDAVVEGAVRDEVSNEHGVFLAHAVDARRGLKIVSDREGRTSTKKASEHGQSGPTRVMPVPAARMLPMKTRRQEVSLRQLSTARTRSFCAVPPTMTAGFRSASPAWSLSITAPRRAQTTAF